MPSRRKLKSVAHNFGASFTSLMNYREHDYVMGHLLRAARNTGLGQFRVDILKQKMEPLEIANDAVQQSVAAYVKRFPEDLKGEGTSIEFVKEATLVISFDLTQTRRKKIGELEFEENPYTCEVKIIDDRDTQHVSVLSGWWFPEDLNPEEHIQINPTILSLFNRFDKFSQSYNKIPGILLIPAIVVCLVISFFMFSEYVNVGILDNTQGYPWGCKCFDNMENYASPEIYASSALRDGLLFLLAAAISIWAIIKKRALYVLVLLLPYLVFSFLTYV